MNKFFALLPKLSPIQKNTFSIFFSIGVLKGTLFLREVLLAKYLGIQRDIDVYFYALIIPNFLVNIIIGSFNYFFIPAYHRIKAAYGANIVAHYAFYVLYKSAGWMLFLSIICAFGIPRLLIQLNPKFFHAPEVIGPFLAASVWTGAFLFFFVTTSFASSLLQAEHHYKISIYPQMLIPALSIAALIHSPLETKVLATFQGATLAASACLLILLFQIWRLKIIAVKFSHGQLKKIPGGYEQFAILVMAFVLPSFVMIVDQHLASTLGSGALSVFMFGSRLPDGLAEILGSTLGIAVFSHFSQWHANQEKSQLIEAIQKIILLSTLIIASLCVFLMIYALPIITVVFERGAFGEASTQLVGRTLQVYGLSIYFGVIATVGARAISATGKNHFFVWLAAILFLIKIFLNLLLMKFLRINGLLLATVLTHLASCLCVFIYLNQESLTIFKSSYSKKFSSCVFILLLVTIILISVKQWVGGQSTITQVITGLCVWVCFTIGVLRFYPNAMSNFSVGGIGKKEF